MSCMEPFYVFLVRPCSSWFFAKLTAASRTQYLFMGCTLVPSELQEHLPNLILIYLPFFGLQLCLSCDSVTSPINHQTDPVCLLLSVFWCYLCHVYAPTPFFTHKIQIYMTLIIILNKTIYLLIISAEAAPAKAFIVYPMIFRDTCDPDYEGHSSTWLENIWWETSCTCTQILEQGPKG